MLPLAVAVWVRAPVVAAVVVAVEGRAGRGTTVVAAEGAVAIGPIGAAERFALAGSVMSGPVVVAEGAVALGTIILAEGAILARPVVAAERAVAHRSVVAGKGAVATGPIAGGPVSAGSVAAEGAVSAAGWACAVPIGPVSASLRAVSSLERAATVAVGAIGTVEGPIVGTGRAAALWAAQGAVVVSAEGALIGALATGTTHETVFAETARAARRGRAGGRRLATITAGSGAALTGGRAAFA